MADFVFGFSTGDDSEHHKRQGESHSSGFFNPFGMSNSFSMDDLGQIFTQLGKIFTDAQHGVHADQSNSGGVINYDLARQIATKSIGNVDPISSTTASAMADAVRLAETWLNGVCALPAGTRDTVVWTPLEWVDHTLETWQRLCDPMAGHISSMWTGALPPDAQQIAAPLMSVISQMGGITFGSQLGQALGRLSGEVLTSTDIGLPLGPAGVAALMPHAIEQLASGLDQPRSELVMLLAAREAAHHRLFTHVPWLSNQLLNAVESYATGMSINFEGMEDLASQLDPTALSDPHALEELLQQGIFEPKATPEQKSALERLETLLALIEGWVRTIVADALGERIPGAAALSEILLRRRATGGPAEQTFSSLVGLELRPRKLREAAALWDRLTHAVGVDSRDRLWQHPDLLPDSADLDDPAGFIDQLLDTSTSDVDSMIHQALQEFERPDDHIPPGEECS